jgi:signal transduction histidine kinase
LKPARRFYDFPGSTQKLNPDKAVPYCRRIMWPTLAGSVVGFFVIQPLVVLVYNLAPETRLAFHDLSFWKRLLEMSLSHTSLFMGVAFAVFSGATGLCFGSWLYHKERLVAEKLESARRLAALQTTKDLMVTLAHYLRNANLVIGGFSHRLAHRVGDPKQQEQLRLIHQASLEIAAVIDSLQDLTEISTTQYIDSGAARMIDLKQELEKRLAAGNRSRHA